MILNDIVWYFMILYEITWYYMILNDIKLYCMIFHDIIWYYIILHDIIWYCINEYWLYTRCYIIIVSFSLSRLMFVVGHEIEAPLVGESLKSPRFGLKPPIFFFGWCKHVYISSDPMFVQLNFQFTDQIPNLVELVMKSSILVETVPEDPLKRCKTEVALVPCLSRSWRLPRPCSQVSIVMGVPPNGWFTRENPMKMNENWGYPYFWKPPMCQKDRKLRKTRNNLEGN